MDLHKPCDIYFQITNPVEEPEDDGAEMFDFLRGITTDILHRFA